MTSQAQIPKPEEDAIAIANLVKANSHVFIEASAGTGKTTRLVALIIEVLRQKKASIAEILCVTFTEKAASELKSRVYHALTVEKNDFARQAMQEFSKNKIGTIHKFCHATLGETSLVFGGEAAGTIVDESEIFEEAREYVYRTQWLSIGAARLSQYLDEIDFGSRDFASGERRFDVNLKRKCLYLFSAPDAVLLPAVNSSEEVVDGATLTSWTIVQIVERMRQVVHEKNLVTFSGMISRMVEAVADEAFVTKLQSRFKFALIDEFQDTDSAQWQIFKTLFLNSTNKLIVVGDPKQAIYKFRGADVFVYLEARNEMLSAGAVDQKLQFNFRSAPAILEVLDTIFCAEPAKSLWETVEVEYTKPKPARAVDSAAGIEFYTKEKYSAGAMDDFARFAALRIRAMQAEHKNWSIAIIAFKHHALRKFASFLQKENIDFAYYRQKPDFSRVEIAHLKLYLQSFMQEEEIGYQIAYKTLFLQGRANAIKLYADSRRQIYDGYIVDFLKNLATDLHVLRVLLAADRDRTVYHGWQQLVQTLLMRCGDVIFDLESLCTSLHELESESEDSELLGGMLRPAGSVTLLTVASAKGLHWNAVIVADGFNDVHWNDFAFFHDANKKPVIVIDYDTFDKSSDKLLTTEAESRLAQLNALYVALTRAKERVIVFIAPPSKSTQVGPVSYFLRPWAEKYAHLTQDFETALQQAEAQAKRALPPAATFGKVEHGDIALRVRENKSFSSLVTSVFLETDFIDDILPRGSAMGNLLHEILETLDFRIFQHVESVIDQEAMNRIILLLGARYKVTEEMLQRMARRVYEILRACARASLPLLKGGSVRLADINADNLWREMPFWSAASTHRELRQKADSRVERSMHGFMDLIFTLDERDYYILDYKSNSLSSVEPDKLENYARDHYAKQAEIYTEALAAYLRAQYPDTEKRVAGFYFLFLRYVECETAKGVHFIEAANVSR